MNRIKDIQPTPYLGNKTINSVTPLLTRQRMQVEFLFIFLEYCFELCDRLFPKYDPMCFIEREDCATNSEQIKVGEQIVVLVLFRT